MHGIWSRLKTWWNGPPKEWVRPELEPIQRASAKQQAQDIYTIDSFDEHLLERARTQWQFGDWASLANIPREALSGHPDRAKIALFVAAGHQAMGNMPETKRFTVMAMEWGCEKRQVGRILVSGVLNTLGRAAIAMGDETRATKLIESSIQCASPANDVKLIGQARQAHQLKELALPRPNLLLVQAIPPANLLLTLLSDIQNLKKSLVMLTSEQSEQMKMQQENSKLFQKSLESTVKKEMLNTTKQLEAFLSVQSVMVGGTALPEMHGWPISPDFAAYIIELIKANEYDLIIEFGSGSSTAIIARTIELQPRSKHGREVIQVAFEHLEEFFSKTKTLIQKNESNYKVRLYLTPLKEYISKRQDKYLYYDCENILHPLSIQFNTKSTRILAVVDGPPASTGKWARYPAVPILRKYFPNAELDVFLDDYSREEERNIADSWILDLSQEKIDINLVKLNFEKGACLINIR